MGIKEIKIAILFDDTLRLDEVTIATLWSYKMANIYLFPPVIAGNRKNYWNAARYF